MKPRRARTTARSGAVVAKENLLAICQMGINNPDRRTRLGCTQLANAIFAATKDWDADGPRIIETDYVEAAA